jgi:ubiquitin carboxyl-terminal hydrolase 8
VDYNDVSDEDEEEFDEDIVDDRGIKRTTYTVDSDSDDDFEFDETTGHVGLRNLGNTCYLNSSLQMLFRVPGFLTDLSATYENLKSTDTNTSTEGEENEIKTMPLCSALLTVASRMRLIPPRNKNDTTREGSARPSILKKEMDKLTDKFLGYEQRDAHEFLSDLIDLLHDELKSAKANHEDYSTELPTDKYFRLDVNVCLTCDSCKYSRSKEELYRHLSVDIGKNKDEEPWTVDQGLDQFFQREQRDIKGEKCEEGLSATQTITVKSRPKTLLLHLKRFTIVEVNDGEVLWGKSNARVKSETSISLEKFTADEVKGGDENQEYGLQGVVRHIGGHAMSGHYTADANRNTLLEQKQQWVNFDDSISSLTSIDKIVVDERSQQNNYIMIKIT